MAPKSSTAIANAPEPSLMVSTISSTDAAVDVLMPHISLSDLQLSTVKTAPCSASQSEVERDAQVDDVHTSALEYSEQCEKCKIVFHDRNSFALHKSDCESKFRDLKCDLCDKTFYSLYRYKRHVRECQRQGLSRHPSNALRGRGLPCLMRNCRATFRRYAELGRHLESAHKFSEPAQYSTHTFENRAQFHDWLHDHQLRTFVFSVKRGGRKRITGNYYYYVCQHDSARFYKIRPTIKKGRRKWQGPIPKHFCPARLCVRENSDGTLSVKHYSFHSHPVDFKNTAYHRAPRQTLKHIQRELSRGVDDDVLLESIREQSKARDLAESDNKSDGNVLRYFEKGPIRQMKYKLNRLKRIDPNDGVAMYKLRLFSTKMMFLSTSLST